MKLADTIYLYLFDHKYVSRATDLIIKRLMKKRGHDSTSNWVDRCPIRVKFLKSKTSGTFEDADRNFFMNILKTRGLPDNMTADRDSYFM